MKKPIYVIIHLTVSIMLGGLVFLARWVFAGLMSEYSNRGPNGEYLYDLSNPQIISAINLTGFAIAALTAFFYWLALYLFRHKQSIRAKA